jgi:phosphoglycolate phosphatase
VKLVIFDMDGTLIDTQALICEHMANTFLGRGLAAPTDAQSRQVIGLSLPITMQRLAKTDDAELIEQLVEDYKSHYRASLVTEGHREGLYPGALETLHQLHAMPDVVLGIATGKGLKGVDRLLELHGLTQHFVTLQTPDNNPSKPHPSMVLTAMREAGATPAQTIMIGDTTFDIEMGVAAKAKTIGVTWGYHEPRDLVAAGADVMIDRYDQMVDAINQLLD